MIRLVALICSFFVFAAQKMPSVSDISAHGKNKFDVQVHKCLANRSDLSALYGMQSVKSYIVGKHKTINCSQIVAQMEKILHVQKSMLDISNRSECAENLHAKVITFEDAKAVRDGIAAKYDEIANEYTQFFTYDATLSNVESCIGYYDEVVVAENIYLEERRKVAAIQQAQEITAKYGLVGVYGDENGTRDLTRVISEIENGDITIKEVSRYSVLEGAKQDWALVGAFDRNLVYSNNKVHIAIPMVKGVSYPGDALPYSLFQIQKKIDIKKNRYSIYIVKPLI